MPNVNDSYGNIMLRPYQKKAVEYGDPEMLPGTRVSDFMEILRMGRLPSW